MISTCRSISINFIAYTFMKYTKAVDRKTNYYGNFKRHLKNVHGRCEEGKVVIKTSHSKFDEKYIFQLR